MTHGSLSSGIGGFDIGAAANGIETLWTSEIDPLRQDILKWLLPHAKHYGDMRQIKKPTPVDIISFGFPCQDISQANPKGKGLEGSKSSLWFEGWRIIRASRPRYVILENSPNLIHRGLGRILLEIAKARYNAEWQVISCRQFGMPHLRERLFIVAHASKVRRKKSNRIFCSKSGEILPEKVQVLPNENLLFQSEPVRGSGWADWFKAIRGFSHLDDGIPRNILQGLYEAAGDTVSPIVTAWIFARIKAVEEGKTGNQQPATGNR